MACRSLGLRRRSRARLVVSTINTELMDWLITWVLGPGIVLSMFVLSRKMGRFRFRNAFKRFAAYWFICLGTLGAVGSIASIIWPDFFDDSRTSTAGLIAIIIVFSLAVVVGARMLRMPTFRPDLGDTMRLMSNEPWPEELARRQGRSPWTGDPLPRSANPPAPHDRAI
jgi:hypothetical protein